MTTSRPQATLDICIGAFSPERWDEIDATSPRSRYPLGGRRRRPEITKTDFDWSALGWQPRWVGEDSSQSVVALEPSTMHNQGAQEWQRFLAGTRARGERALAVSFVGSLEKPEFAPLALGAPGASVNLAGADYCSVGGDEVALVSTPEPAPELGRAEHALAVRIAGTREVSLPWWQLRLSGQEVSYPGSWAPERAPVEGTLQPLLVSGTGEVVAAVWTSPDETIRHYLLPWMPSWEPVLDWLFQRAVPELVPSAARRARGSLSSEPELLTSAESAARRALSTLDAEYATRRAELAELVRAATAEADTVRDPLLYESGTPLVAAVTRVLTDAGLTVVDLDEEFGDTVSADLLVSHGRRTVLVEVKGASGMPGEKLVEQTRRHLTTWPKLRPAIPVEGVALIVNHQTRTHPIDRSAKPFTRPEFVASLSLPVLSATQLFGWWRVGRHDLLRAHLFGHRLDDAAAREMPDRLASEVTVDEGGTPTPKRGMFRWGSRRPR